MINIKPTKKLQGIKGKIIADYNEKSLSFNGLIIPTNISDTIDNKNKYSYTESKAREVKWNIFNWI
jgi:hypothetical protein